MEPQHRLGYTGDYQTDNADALRKQTADLVSEEIDALDDGVRGFEEGVVILISPLDELSKVHPFVAGKF